MRVGFGATVLARGLHDNKLDGIGYYSQELASSLWHSKKIGVEPIVFGANIIRELFQTPVHNLPGFKFGLGIGLLGLDYPSSQSLCSKIDLFHATDHLIPRLKKVPVVATIMDAIPVARPQWTNRQFRNLKNFLWKRTVSWADHIITISEYSKKDIVEFFGVASESITVTPLGVDARYFEPIEAKLSQTYLNRVNLQPGRFFLFVGTLQPRKNIEAILEAYVQLPELIKKATPLVIVGREGWGCTDLVARLAAYAVADDSQVKWFKGVADLEKRILMQNATALVFPSLYEGFGLPVIEAFASGLPVVTSNTTSLPEVAQGAALLVSPTDTEQLADAMNRIVEEDGLRARLKSAGLLRARDFTWTRCAEETLKAYHRVLPT